MIGLILLGLFVFYVVVRLLVSSLERFHTPDYYEDDNVLRPPNGWRPKDGDE